MTKHDKTLYLFKLTTDYFARVNGLNPVNMMDRAIIDRNFDAVYAWLEKRLDEKLANIE